MTSTFPARPMATGIAQDVTELIGNTPLVSINRLGRTAVAGSSIDTRTSSDTSTPAATGTSSATPLAPGVRILAKVEAFEPASSVKDRVALAIIRAAEASGDLPPGGTIIEATSGNTGVGLAMVGAALGYRVIIVMPDTMSKERRAIMRAFGAELVLTSEGGMAGAVSRAQELQAATPGSILASQFTHPANPATHRRTTAREILTATQGQVDVFVAGVGTGGTVTGVGSALKEKLPELRVIAVEPEESPLLSGGQAGPHKIQGIGANFVPEVYDADVVDEVLTVTSQQALLTARDAARHEGLLVGISSGAALAAAVRVAQRPEMEGRTIVTLLPDTGERYLSTPLFQDLLN